MSVAASDRLPVPPPPIEPPFTTVTLLDAVQVGLVRVADDEHERLVRRYQLELVQRLRDQRRLVHEHDVDLADEPAASTSAKLSSCASDGSGSKRSR